MRNIKPHTKNTDDNNTMKLYTKCLSQRCIERGMNIIIIFNVSVVAKKTSDIYEAMKSSTNTLSCKYVINCIYGNFHHDVICREYIEYTENLITDCFVKRNCAIMYNVVQC